MLGVLLIDFYMFRPFFLIFYGPERIPPEADREVHESPGVMTGPLVVLAFGSAVVGAYFHGTHGLVEFLATTPSLACRPAEGVDAAIRAAAHTRIAMTTTAVVAVGVVLSAMLYLGSRKKAAWLARAMNVFGLYSLSYGKFFFDPIYEALVVWPLLGVARLAAALDHYVIDGLVDFCGGMPKTIGAAFRPAHNGLLQFYALAMMLGLLVLIGALLL